MAEWPGIESPLLGRSAPRRWRVGARTAGGMMARMMATKKQWGSTLAAVLTIVASACGGEGPRATDETQSDERQSVVIRMDWTAAGYHAPFVLARDQGYYDEEGLDAQIVEGSGSDTTSQSVASSGEFGFVQLGSAMTLISQDAPIVVVAPVVQQSSTIVGCSPEANVAEPRDLEGTRFGYNPGGSDVWEVPLFLEKNGVDADEVHLVSTGPGRNAQLMARGRIDCATYVSIFEIPLMEQEGIDFTNMPFSDYGLNTMAYAIIANSSTVEDDPNMVEGVVRASLRGWEDAVNDPDAAIQALVQEFPVVDPENALAQLELTIPLLHTDATQGMPIGCFNDDDIENVEMILTEGGLIQTATSTAETYTTHKFLSC